MSFGAFTGLLRREIIYNIWAFVAHLSPISNSLRQPYKNKLTAKVMDLNTMFLNVFLN